MTANERSKIITLTNKHCRQMMDMIYKKKMAYFQSGGDDWKEVLERSYPRDPPKIEPPIYDKEAVYENNLNVFEQVRSRGIYTRVAASDSLPERIFRQRFFIIVVLGRDCLSPKQSPSSVVTLLGRARSSAIMN